MQNIHRKVCPYLGTVNRPLLDFDFEKQCSVSLVKDHVYCCLVCGKYFEGRGAGTHCYKHSMEYEHYMFIHLKNSKVYCLPDNYEVADASLSDIKRYLNPLNAGVFTDRYVTSLDKDPIFRKALDGQDYRVGLLGLNDLKKTDYINCVIQVMCRIQVLRNYLLLLDLSNDQKPDEVVLRLSDLMRKVFNTENFKGLVSPHEFTHAVIRVSRGQFKIGKQSDPGDFLLWLLRRLHAKLPYKEVGYTRQSLVTKLFQLEIETITSPPLSKEDNTKTVETVPSLLLNLEVPPPPVFANALDDNVIPHVQIFDLLEKYSGDKEILLPDGRLRHYRIKSLPEYLIMKHNRFSRNEFYVEKNPTIVTFPLKNLDLRTYLHPDSHGDHPMTRYSLVASITHTGKPEEGEFKVHIFHEVTGEWFECDHLRIQAVLPGDVAISPTYIQIWKQSSN